LGISDDIRPKKYRPVVNRESIRETVKKDSTEKGEVKDRITSDFFSGHRDDDFFSDTPIGNNDKKNRPKNQNQSSLSKKNDSLKKKKKSMYPLILIFFVITFAAIIVWQNFTTIKSLISGDYKQQNDKSLNDIIGSTNQSLNDYSTTDNSLSTETPTPAPQAETSVIDKSTVVVSVLNGSGVKNSAKTVADGLKAEGYNVANTANANSFAYMSTFIYYKSGKENEANLIHDSLAQRQTELKLSDSIVGKSYDIVVVVGKN